MPVVPRPIARTLLLAGPTLTARFVAGAFAGGPMAEHVTLAFIIMVVLLWSPLPMMLPAVVLQDASDEVGHGPWCGPVRSYRSLLARGSSVRTEAGLALVGWLAGLAAITSYLLI